MPVCESGSPDDSKLKSLFAAGTRSPEDNLAEKSKEKGKEHEIKVNNLIFFDHVKQRFDRLKIFY